MAARSLRKILALPIMLLLGSAGPGYLPDSAAADAIGRLASYVAACERQDARVQPVALDGTYDLVTLLFVTLGRMDLNRIEMPRQA